ncbi:leukotriene A4 hydrolase C-terminal domain-containing protein, partial [Duganella sp.]|uniref:leukotriene A4 hydrolase C-terminal domain-containing protein n=1 Tax=Duganella sp. TaxID=1904440 RepID=UPI0031D6419A
WKYTWLNEGFTTYVTTRIVEKLYGEEVAEMNLQVEQEEALASVKAGYNVREPLGKFLNSVGRKLFVVPLYTALLKNPNEKDWARTVYAKARSHYHPITQAAVDKAFKKQ